MEEDIGVAMLGGNRNVNITSPDSGDNVKVPNYKQKRGMGLGDYVQLGIGMSIVSAVYIFLWFLSINISNFYCWTKYDIACQSTDVIHWTFLAGIILVLLMVIFYIAQQVYNAGYLFQRGVYLDRRQVTEHTLALINVMNTSARSEATSGLDTYSPSYTNTAPSKTVADSVVDDNAFVASLLAQPVTEDTIYNDKEVIDATADVE